MTLPGRTHSSPAYRYGFQGQEKDDELKDIGNSYDFGARMLDPRVGRWFAPDAFERETPSWSTYRFGFNNPIYWIDKDGNREFPTYRLYKEYAKKNCLEILSETEMYKQGHWLSLHRNHYISGGTYASGTLGTVFSRAAALNTASLASSEYTNLEERQAYYKWANNFFSGKGFEVKWMKAAESTVGTLSLALLPPASWFGYSNDEINTFIRDGNKLILDDMIPKVNELVTIYSKKGALKGDNALKWDAQALSEEQNLIQSLYDQLSTESVKILQKKLENFYGFEDNVLDASDRWRFGMKQMGYDVTPDMMPEPGGNYEDVNLQIKKENK
jgi:RHS repeat-associated protein